MDAKPVLLIESYALRATLKEAQDGFSGVSFDTKVVALPWPYELIYHKEKKLREIAKEKDEATKLDIEILLREVEQRQATERKDAERLAQSGQVTYDLLWTLFHLGLEVVQKNIMGTQQVSIIAPLHTTPASYHADQYWLDLWNVEYNGNEFTYLESTISIKKFKETKAITDLEVFPLNRWKISEGECTEHQRLCMSYVVNIAFSIPRT